MQTETVKPARAGLKVRDPERGGHLREDGDTVPLNSYWLRRKADGDVISVKDTAKPAAAPKKRDEE